MCVYMLSMYACMHVCCMFYVYAGGGMSGRIRREFPSRANL